MSSLQEVQFKQILVTPENDITFTMGGSSDSDKDQSVDSIDIRNSVVHFIMVISIILLTYFN